METLFYVLLSGIVFVGKSVVGKSIKSAAGAVLETIGGGIIEEALESVLERVFSAFGFRRQEKRQKKELYEKIFVDPKWLHLEGFAGFVLPSGGKTRVAKYNFLSDGERLDNYQKDDPEAEKYKDGKPFFEINLLHGENPKDASYQYITLPNATKEATEAYAEAPEVEIIANTKKLQAVRKASLGLTFITFHEAGECQGIKVNAPCIVSILESEGEKTIAVADPTHKNPEIKLTLDKAYKLIYAPILAKVGERCGKTTVTAATKELAGEAVRVTFKA